MRAIVRIIDPIVGRAVEFPQVVISREALDSQLHVLRGIGTERYGRPCYGYVVYR